MRKRIVLAGPAKLHPAAMGVAIVALTLASLIQPSRSQDAPSAQTSDAASAAGQEWAIHGQATFIEQYHPAFSSPYRGPNSLDPASRGDETLTATLFLGVSPWHGAEIWINPEIDQGFGLSNGHGIADFPNGDAYKLGDASPYPKLQRLFIRQTIDLGGTSQPIEPDINQLGGGQTANRLVITAGKFAVPDIFDHNTYADDPRNYFLNWALVDVGTFDYAANAWGYTYGAGVEWYEENWVVRAGAFDLSAEPNSTRLETTFGRQFELTSEIEEDHTLWDRPGKLRLIAFLNHGRMGLYRDAIAQFETTGLPADLSGVRHMHERVGIALTLEQQLYDDLGLFGRAGYSDPSREPFDFTDDDWVVSEGLSLNGNRWDRNEDVVGLAFVVGGISHEHATFLNDGGLGILVGDGKLPHPGAEDVVETFYKYVVREGVTMLADYQLALNPAFNRDRGPVSILGARLHLEF